MSKKTYPTVDAVFAEVATRKARAAKARREPRAADAEAPREIYGAACAAVAAALAADGFSYAKSRATLTRKAGDVTHRVLFQSSHNNVAGEHVAMWMYAHVQSAALGAWREKQRRRAREDDFVAGGMVHLLEPDGPKMIEWELARAAARDAAVADVVSHLRSVVLPYFSLFAAPPALIERLKRRSVPAFELASSVEYALCFGDARDAQAILDAYLRERPDLEAPSRAAQEKLATSGPPARCPNAYAEQIAWLRVVHSLA
ncbi:MAG: hypothetical protein HYV09_11390 [Deltaproteobacteria bacterium]|nr:hypothetical protein [Deltaproteobacteria bacterium]